MTGLSRCVVLRSDDEVLGGYDEYGEMNLDKFLHTADLQRLS